MATVINLIMKTIKFLCLLKIYLGKFEKIVLFWGGGGFRKMLQISETFSHSIFFNKFITSRKICAMTDELIKLSTLNRQNKIFFINISISNNMVMKCEIFKILLSNGKRQFFCIFQEIPLKSNSLYASLVNYSKTFISESYSTKIFWKEGVSLR